MKTWAFFLLLFFNFFFVFGQELEVHSIVYSDNKQILDLKDDNLQTNSIIFFLPIDSYDTTIWNDLVIKFLHSLKPSNFNRPKVYKYFFEAGNCANCGLQIKNHLDTTNISIYFPSCFISGYAPNLIERAVKLPALSSYGYNAINDHFSIGQITYKNSPICIDKPIIGAEFDIWRPFIQEVFYPKYSTDEKINLLLHNQEISAKKIDDLLVKITILEDSIKVVNTKLSEIKSAVEPKSETKKKSKIILYRKKKSSDAKKKDDEVIIKN